MLFTQEEHFDLPIPIGNDPAIPDTLLRIFPGNPWGFYISRKLMSVSLGMGMMKTGILIRWRTFSATLPKKVWASKPLPCVPIITTSAFRSSAFWRISSAGSPSTTCMEATSSWHSGLCRILPASFESDLLDLQYSPF
jgi:hypothetical protein